jgi:glycine cleavage system H protein
MNIPDDLRYTEEHEWVKQDGDQVVVGITDYAQGELGDVVYVDLPSPGDHFDQNDPFGSIEAVKAASDLFTPMAGEIVEVNDQLGDEPETINKDPYGSGWMIKLKLDNPDDLESLLDASGYKTHIGE